MLGKRFNSFDHFLAGVKQAACFGQYFRILLERAEIPAGQFLQRAILTVCYLNRFHNRFLTGPLAAA